MLTADLALSWQRGDQIKPRYVNAADPRWLREAATLVQLFKEHAGRTRGELERAVEEYAGTGTDYRVLRGLQKLLTDRCEFATAMRLKVKPQAAEGFRELFGAIKAHGLIHTVKGSPSAGYGINLDGPESL